MLFGKTRYSHVASLHPGVEMGTSKLSGKPDEMLLVGRSLNATEIWISSGLCGPLGSSADLTLYQK